MVKKKIYSGTSKHISRATLVEGILKDGEQSFRCLFVENSDIMPYLLPRLYRESPMVLENKRLWIPSLRKTVANRSDAIDIGIAVLPTRHESDFEGLYGFKGQEHVRQIIDTSGSWEEITSRFHKNPKETMRKIRKHGLSYRISNDWKEFHHFYHRMYLPLIRKQHGDSVSIDSFEEMEPFFEKGFLLLVEERGRAIAGSLCWIDNEVFVFRRIGVLDANEEHLKKGGQSAIYYFVLLAARDRNLKRVDLMKSRSFLNDGVYRHKREWGAAVCPDDESETWLYFFHLGSPEKIARFYERNPVIVHTKDGLKGVVGVSNGLELSPEVQDDLADRFYAPGLEGLILLTPKSTTPIEFSFQK